MSEKTALTAGKEFSLSTKLTLTLMGALLLGGMWRIRGDAGFGSFWGMLPVSLVFFLFIISFLGFRKKFTYDILPWMVLSIPLTINAWMPIMSLLPGTVESPGGGIENYSYLNAVFLIFTTGFAWMTFLGFFIGITLSPRRYSAANLLSIVALYFVVMYAFRLFLAHYMALVLSPESVDLFARGLLEKGVSETPMQFHMHNYLKFNDANKDFIGGRLYYNIIASFSSAVGALSVSALLFFGFKDRGAAKKMLSVLSIVGIAFVGAALLRVLASNGFRGSFDSSTLPAWFMRNFWGFCEYSVGFIAGLGITAFLVFRKRAPLMGETNVENKLKPSSKNKYWCFAYHMFVTCTFMLAASIIRPIESRIKDSTNNAVSESTLLLIMVPVFLLVFAPIFYRNIVKKELGRPFSMDIQRFAIIAAPTTLFVFTFTDLIIGYSFWEEPPVRPLHLLVSISFVLVCVGYLLQRKKLLALK